MTEYLKGNYELDAKIEAPTPSTCSPFERAALARLGGSICFVQGGPMVWTGREPE